MAKETRLVFGIEDIAALRVECTNCHSEVAVPVMNGAALSQRCPSCGQIWYNREERTFWNLLTLLLDMRTQTDPLLTVRFEVVESQG